MLIERRFYSGYDYDSLQIVTGVTGDTRPVFGMNIKDYHLGDYEVRVQNSISAGNIALANVGAYRMFRRQGIQFTTDQTGRTNRLTNTKILIARMRWGGQMPLASGYIAEMSDGSVS